MGQSFVIAASTDHRFGQANGLSDSANFLRSGWPVFVQDFLQAVIVDVREAYQILDS